MKNQIKVKDIIKRDFFKVSFLTSISSFVKIVTNLGVSKFLAIAIGPSGIALYGQFLNIATLILTFGNLSIIQGVTKFVAEYNDSDNTLRDKTIQTAIKIIIVSSLSISILTFIFSKELSIFTFNNVNYLNLYRFLSFNIILISLNTLLLGIINGFKQFKRFVLVNIIQSLVGATLTICLVYYFKLDGVLYAYILVQSIIFFIQIFLNKDILSSYFTKSLISSFDRPIFKSLIAFSLISLTSMILSPASNFFIRSQIIDTFGIKYGGYWEALNKMSVSYLSILTATLPVYILPRLSEIKENIELVKEVYFILRTTLSIVLILVIMIFIFRELIIKILLSSDFLEMKLYFLPQLVGDIFKIGSWVLAYTFIAKSKIKQFVAIEVFFNLFYCTLVFLLSQLYPMEVVVWSYTITYLVYFVIYILLFKTNFVKNDG
ncbi:MAG: O-antigen translocase [Chitinophagales bacterium]|nr:O-antigen translocase [Chitinophagales bacterium]